MSKDPRDEALSHLSPIRVNEQNLYALFDCAKAIVPFVGAGLSTEFYPSWSKLLRNLSETAQIEAEIEIFLSQGRLEEAAERVYQADPRGFNNGVHYEFREELIHRPILKGVLSQLPKIGQGVVLTTNFDRVLEAAFQDADTPFEEVFPGTDIVRATEAIQKHKRCLLKLHGDYKDERSRILTLSEYRAQYGAEPGKIDVSKSLPKVLGHALLAGPVLFIGCSLQSDRTLEVLQSIAAEYEGTTFFALLSARQCTAARMQELSHWNIRPLFFPDGRYDKLADFLKCLAQHCERFDSTRELVSADKSWTLHSATRNTAEHLFETIKSGYIESILRQTLAEGVPIALRLKERREDGLWHELPQTTSAAGLFRQAGLGGASRLLITGAGGSGKTIQLLRCVEALLPPLEDLASMQIPVVFSASSWHDPNRETGGAKDLRTWITSQFLDQYGVPPVEAAKLMESFRLVYCIDGLDEIHPSCTQEFLQQLGDFIRTGQGRIPAGFILAGRVPSDENLDLLASLGFTQFHLLPLDDADIQHCLQENRLTLLLQLAKEPFGQQLLSNPLELQILATVYGEQYTPDEIDRVLHRLRNDPQQWHSDVYERYFSRRISRFLQQDKEAARTFSQDEIRHYLSRIGSYLGNIQDFRLDLLQPTELPDEKRIPYRVLAGALISAGVLVTVGVPVLVGISVANHFSGDTWGASLMVGLKAMLFAGVIGGLLVGAAYIFLEGIWYAVAVAIAFSIGRGFAVGAFAPSSDASSLPVITQLTLSFVAALSFFVFLFWGVGDRAYVIAPIETWTMKRGRMFGGSMLLALLVAASVAAISPSGGIPRGFAFGATIGVFMSRRFGRTPLEKPIRVRPNQGIIYSAREAVRNAFVVTSLCALAFGLSYGVGFSGSNFKIGLQEGIVNALLALILLVTFFFFGGLAVVKHIALRVTLATEKMLPLRTEKFLLAMASAGILRNAGGSFRFPHATVRDHFAANAHNQKWKIRA